MSWKQILKVTFDDCDSSTFIKLLFFIGSIFPFLAIILESTGVTSQSKADDDYSIALANSNELLNSSLAMLSLGFAVGASGT